MEDETNRVSEERSEWHSFASGRKTITYFKSFEEARDYGRQQMASRSPKERLEVLEEMRKHFLKDFLLPDGKWPPIQPVIAIKKGVFNRLNG
jgi:hypothetical protein